jgi:predicted metalloprotease with PDZ domain
MKRRRNVLLFFAALAATLSITATAARAAQNAATPIRLKVDLRDAARRIFHARLTMPVKPGPLTLLYPKWIPGEHAPDGPIADLVDLKFSAAGRTLPWRRDDLDMFAFHIDVPEGSASIEVDYDYLSPVSRAGFSAGPSADPALVMLEWNLVVLYPAGPPSHALTYQASLLLPHEWKFASALPLARQQGDEIDFQPVPLNILVDSPVLTGEYMKSLALAPDIQPPHHLNIAADSPAALKITSDQVEAYSRLVREAGALFGARHYDHYDFLLALTDAFDTSGLEHHQSSDDRAPERMFINSDETRYLNSLLAHEFTHSWNGKFRRPAGLATPDFEHPMKDDLLWVYEGLTEYVGEMLSARAGLRTQDDYREELAWTAASLDHWPGRTWRPLEDTAVAAQILYDVPDRNWASWRRGVDFYSEGWLLWLDVDILIRRESHGRKSLDDFCRAFFGPPSTGPLLEPYTLDDLIAALNKVQPYDWREFFRTRVDEIRPHPPLGGIEKGGWQLVYNSTPNGSIRTAENVTGVLDLSFSLGMLVQTKGNGAGRLDDVIPGLPAAQAGLAPGMRLVSVEGRAFSAGVLTDAIRAAQNNDRPIVITADNSGFVNHYEIDYRGGERYPHLVRNTAQPDLLTQTLLPLTSRGK